nr:hypothetical protein CFP56_35962 [Quercus suber]
MIHFVIRIVKKCGYRLLYQHDEEQFERKLKHGNCLLSDFLDSHHQFLAAPDKRTGRNPDNEVGHGRNVHSNGRVTVAPVIRLSYALEIVKTKTRLLKSDLLDFDECSIYNSCCPPREILDWFNHSDEQSVAINIAKNDWMGLVLYAYFSVQEDQTNIFQNPNSTISHHLICLFETDVVGLEQELHIHSTNIEEFMFLEIEGGFLWLSYIPRCWFPDWLNQCSCLKASIMSDWPGLMVQKCGLRFFHVHDEEEFERIIYRCHLASENGVLTSQLLLKSDNSRAENPLGENGQHPYNQPCQSNLTDFTVQMCGLRLLYQHNEEEFKEIIKRTKAGGVWIDRLGRIMGIFGDRQSSSNYSDDEAFGGVFIRIRCYGDDGSGVALRTRALEVFLLAATASMIGV